MPSSSPGHSLLWQRTVAGLRQNLIPGLVLQVVAISVIVAYYTSPAARDAMGRIADLKTHYGYLYSALATAFFGGLIPFLYLAATGRAGSVPLWQQGLFYVGLWTWKGAEVDAFYRLQAAVFGDEPSAPVIAVQVIIDQFVYNPLWAAPSIALCMMWKEHGFSFRSVRHHLDRSFITLTIPSVLLSTWVVWVPAVSIIYAMPAPLRIPLFNLVLCFFVLVLAMLAPKPRPAPAP